MLPRKGFNQGKGLCMDIKRIFTNWPFQKKLLLLLLVLFLPALGIIVTSGLSHRHTEIIRAQNEALLLTQSLATQQEQIIITTKALLSTMAQLPEVQRLDEMACDRIFHELNLKYPFYSEILAVTPDGRVFAGSMPPDTNTNLADLKYIKDVIRTLDFSVGEGVRGKISNAPSLHYAVPVLDAHRKLVAILIAGFDLNEFGHFISAINLPEGSAVVFVDHQGLRLYRSPGNGASPIGKPTLKGYFDSISGSVAEGLFEWTGVDGINRINAFKQLRLRENSPPYMHMVVGLPKDTILRKANLNMLRNLLILGFTTLLALSLAWILANVVFINPINRLVTATQQFAQGDMDTRTGLPHTLNELGRLAQAFDDMASILETRNIERGRVEEALNKAYAELEDRVQERTAELTASSVALRVEITERQQTEETLLQSQQQLKSIFRVAPVGIGLVYTRVIQEANETMCRMTGYSREELVGQNARLLYPTEEEYGYVGSEKYRQIAERGTGTVETHWKRKDGNIINILLSSTALDATDPSKGVTFTALDITKRKQAEDALRDNEQFLTDVFNGIQDGMIILDPDLTIISVNPAIEKLPLVQPIVGRKCYEVIHGRSEPCEVCSARPVFQTGEPAEKVHMVNADDGSIIFMEIHAFPLLNRVTGQVDHVIEFTRNITERKRAEEDWLRFSKLESMSILAGGIAHDFNNILTTILGNIDLAMLTRKLGEESMESLTHAEQACFRAQELSGQLLTFAKGGAPIKKAISLSILVRESVKLSLAGSKSSCEFSIPEDLWSVEADEGQINQVISNLLINADQAMPSGGIIKLGAGNVVVEEGSELPLPGGKYVKLTITDQGIGIPRKHLGKLFDPYFTTKQKGSGLGLATAYSVINKHSGSIKVESQVGVGTTFELFLPAKEAKALGAHEDPVTPIIGQGKILVMDDDEKIRKTLCRMLIKLGYEVDSASDGFRALEKFVKATESGRQFDAVILDLTVPGGMGGKETIEKLLRIDPQIRAIVSSGYSDDPIMADFQKYGFSEVMAKPYRIVELSKILQRVISNKGDKG
jgi:PAS domain S-box-containing protein